MSLVEFVGIIIVQGAAIVVAIYKSHESLKVEFNGRMTELLETTRKLARLEGAHEQRLADLVHDLPPKDDVIGGIIGHAYKTFR